MCIDFLKQKERVMCASIKQYSRLICVSTFLHIFETNVCKIFLESLFDTNVCIDFVNRNSILMCASTFLNSKTNVCIDCLKQNERLMCLDFLYRD